MSARERFIAEGAIKPGDPTRFHPELDRRVDALPALLMDAAGHREAALAIAGGQLGRWELSPGEQNRDAFLWLGKNAA